MSSYAVAVKSNSRPLQHRGNRVAAVLAYNQPEAVAEQLLAQQEHNNDIKQQLKHALTDARHKEAELRRCRQVLLAAEGLLQAQQQPPVLIVQPTDQDGDSSTAAFGSSSPRTYCVRQLLPGRAAAAALSRTQQACLIGALKDQNAVLKATVSQLNQQCAALAQPGGIAVQVESLQRQLTQVLEQLQQQQVLVHQHAVLAEDAQQTAQAAAAHAELASTVLQEVRAAAAAASGQGHSSGNQLGQELLDLIAKYVDPVPAGLGASGPWTPRALAAAQDAHSVLLQQALLLRGGLSAVPGAAGEDAAHGRPRSASRGSSPSGPDRPDTAAELSMFLRSHVASLRAMLDSLPGATAASLQQQSPASSESIGSWRAGARAAAAGVPGDGQTEEQQGSDSSSSLPAQCTRPRSAQAVYSSSRVSGMLPAAGLHVRPASAAPAAASRRMQCAQKPQEPHLHEFSPYLNYPARRVASGRSNEVAALQGTVQQLQALVKEQQLQMYAQTEEAMQLQKYAQSVHQELEAAQQQLADSRSAASAKQQQLQQAAEQLRQHNAQLEQQVAAKQLEVTEVHVATAAEQQLLHTAVQQLQQHSVTLQRQLAALQPAVSAQQLLQAEVQSLQQQCTGVQQQLAAAQQERDDAQQLCHAEHQQLQPMLEQVQQLQLQVGGYAAKQQLQRQLQQLEQALLQSEQHLQEQHANQSLVTAASTPADAAGLAHSVAAYAAELLEIPAGEALNGDRLQEVGAAVTELLAAMRQVLALGASAEEFTSADTEQLEEQLAVNTEAVEQCMAALQEVCAMSRRASAAGPAL